MKSPITKTGALKHQLEAATYLLLRDFPPEPTHTLIGASRGLLYGLHKHRSNLFLGSFEKMVLTKIVPGKEGQWKFYQNRAANFLKHADRDPDEKLTQFNLPALNEIDLLICILSFWYISQPLSEKLAIGIIYCGLLNESWFDLVGMCRDAGLSLDELDNYRQMTAMLYLTNHA